MPSAYDKAKADFEKAGPGYKKFSILRCEQDGEPCPTCGQNTAKCEAPAAIVEEFRGISYHFEGQCEAGHSFDRYGYAEAPMGVR